MGISVSELFLGLWHADSSQLAHKLEPANNMQLFCATWLPLIPSANELGAIINALQAHHLIQVNDGVIQVTPKGKEYQQWRGELPKPPLTTG